MHISVKGYLKFILRQCGCVSCFKGNRFLTWKDCYLKCDAQDTIPCLHDDFSQCYRLKLQCYIINDHGGFKFGGDLSTFSHGAQPGENCTVKDSGLDDGCFSGNMLNFSHCFSESELIVIRRTCRYLKKTLAEKHSLKNVAKNVGTNRSRLAELFKKGLRVGVFEWLTRIRLREASKLLRQTRWSVQRIGEQVGYVNCAHFSTAFKKYFGVSPNVYRKTKHPK